ncbi:hypothetical protein [Wielerella bovis]|uniref:hypothetical protein n=1 Tax=Wielerella bovis TaxID=2917790 RepID=UPI002018866C|nr:hypothetical protein [Wielerella bovis]MCG7657445.1 hypothetical protein [Wielerella bovis]MCG7659666.1 hypothetical protein [Wielerella bovis]
MDVQKLILPQWFWRLTPVLTARQSPQEFEAWLFTSAAEPIFPEHIYQALIWINYQQTTAQVYRSICAILSEDEQFLEKMADIHAVLSLLSGEYYDWTTCTKLPLPENYGEEIYALLLEFDEWEIFGHVECDKSIAERKIACFLDELCAYLSGQSKKLSDIPIL